MGKGVILYRSKYGATAKYAEWLAEETGFDIMQTKEASVEKLSCYDTIVLGGGVYASGIAGIGFLRKNLKQLQGKRLAVFCAGASPYEEKAFQELYAHNFKDGLKGLPPLQLDGGRHLAVHQAGKYRDRLPLLRQGTPLHLPGRQHHHGG